MTRDDFTYNGRFAIGAVQGSLSISTPAEQAEIAKLLTEPEKVRARSHLKTLMAISENKCK